MLIVFIGLVTGDLNLTGAFLKELEIKALAPDNRFLSSSLTGDLTSIVGLRFFLSSLATRLSYKVLPLFSFAVLNF
jgi:hypothetical protein